MGALHPGQVAPEGATTYAATSTLGVVGSALGTGVIAIATVGAELRCTGELFGTIRTIYHLDLLVVARSWTTHCGLVVAPERGAFVAGLHHRAGSTAQTI